MEGVFDHGGWEPFLWIAAISAAVYGLHLIWEHGVKPLWRIVVAIVEFTKMAETITDIAHEFKPNEGSSLRDQVDGIKIAVNNISQQVEMLVQIHEERGDIEWDTADDEA